MMQKEMRKPPPKTLEAALAQDYEIIYNQYSKVSSHLLYMIETQLLKSEVPGNVFIFYFIEEFDLFLQNLRNSSHKKGFVGWKSTMTPINSNIDCVEIGASFIDQYIGGKQQCNFDQSIEEWKRAKKIIKPFEGIMPLTLKENYFSVLIGFEFGNRFSPFLHIGNEVIGWLLNGGILQYWHKQEETRMLEEDPEGPVVLFFDDLSFGFVLWLGACGISTVAIFAEFLVLRGKIWWMQTERFCRETLTFFCVFQALRLRLKSVVL
jgi:hypothetical protein